MSFDTCNWSHTMENESSRSKHLSTALLARHVMISAHTLKTHWILHHITFDQKLRSIKLFDHFANREPNIALDSELVGIWLISEGHLLFIKYDGTFVVTCQKILDVTINGLLLSNAERSESFQVVRCGICIIQRRQCEIGIYSYFRYLWPAVFQINMVSPRSTGFTIVLPRLLDLLIRLCISFMILLVVFVQSSSLRTLTSAWWQCSMSSKLHVAWRHFPLSHLLHANSVCAHTTGHQIWHHPILFIWPDIIIYHASCVEKLPRNFSKLGFLAKIFEQTGWS